MSRRDPPESDLKKVYLDLLWHHRSHTGDRMGAWWYEDLQLAILRALVPGGVSDKEIRERLKNVFDIPMEP